MTTPEQPPATPAQVLAYARRPAGPNQRPTRRTQMLLAAEHAALVLEEAAAGDVDPDRLRLAAAGLLAAGHRLGEAKPRRQSSPLPRRGRLTEAGRDVTLDQLRAATTAAAAYAATLTDHSAT